MRWLAGRKFGTGNAIAGRSKLLRRKPKAISKIRIRFFSWHMDKAAFKTKNFSGAYAPGGIS